MSYLFDSGNWEWLWTGNNFRFLIEGFLVFDYVDRLMDGDVSGGPPGMMPATALWNNFDELKKYTMVLLSCPCTEARAARGIPRRCARSR